MSNWRRSLIGLGFLLLAGCASVPVRNAQTDAIQRFMNDAARTHHRDPISVVVVAQPAGAAARYRMDAHSIELDPFLLDSVHLWAVVAHETSHYLLRHDINNCPMASRARCEQDATAAGVGLLVNGRGLTEFAAMTEMYWLLREQHDHIPTVFHGHADACDEITDLLARFPQHRALWQTWECAPHSTSSQDSGTAPTIP